MKLDTQIVDFIQNAARVCKLVGIENMVIDQNIAGGIHSNRTVAVLHQNIPQLPFTQIGLTRLSDLLSRLDIARSQENFSAEATVKPGSDYVFNLMFKAKGTKIDYRCADPTRIEVKRKNNDTPKYKVIYNETVLNMLSKGMSAMSTNKSTDEQFVTLIGNSEGVSFELVDVSNDVFKFVFPEPAEILIPGETTPQFANRYSSKLLLSVLKSNPKGSFEIGVAGSLKIEVSGITTFLVPLSRSGG